MIKLPDSIANIGGTLIFLVSNAFSQLLLEQF
jgi:hypothetical protein